MTKRICPVSGHTMTRGSRPVTVTYAGLSTTFDMDGWYCDAGDECDEGIHAGPDMKAWDRALNRLKARAEGLPGPEAVRRIRKRLKLTQKEAGRIVGGGPNAFQKYESGDVLVGRGIASALLLLERDPSGLDILRARADARRADRAA